MVAGVIPVCLLMRWSVCAGRGCTRWSAPQSPRSSACRGIGLPAGVAIAGTLLYRAIKLGLVLAVGGVTLLFIRRGAPASAVEPGSSTEDLA